MSTFGVSQKGSGFDGFETHVEAFDGVGEGADGDEVHTTKGIVAERIDGDAARGLYLHLTY